MKTDENINLRFHGWAVGCLKLRCCLSGTHYLQYGMNVLVTISVKHSDDNFCIYPCAGYMFDYRSI